MTPPRPIRVPTQMASGGRAGGSGPSGAVGELELWPGAGGSTGPERHDVVVGLVGGRDLDQEAQPPLPQSCSGSTQTEGRALVAERLVLVVVEVAVALQQAEAARVLVDEGETCSVGGLVSGRQTHSPLPRHIDSPSESWISSRHSSRPRRSFSPNQNMLVMRCDAQPLRSACAGTAAPVTSMVVTPPGEMPKR